MMVSLFSSFDPATPSIFSLHWVMLLALFWPTLLSQYAWANTRPRIFLLWCSTTKGITHHSFGYPDISFILTCYTAASIIIRPNYYSMLPYTFTLTAHPAFTAPLALTLWGMSFFYALFKMNKSIMAHHVPLGTPTLLIPFMVMIEFISNFIRPITLIIRLTANMLAGHLILNILMSSSASATILISSLMLPSQMLMVQLELAVCAIQTYVFVVLVNLYLNEYTNS